MERTPIPPQRPAANPPANQSANPVSANPGNPGPAKKGIPAWVWILIALGALLLVGGGIALAFVMLQPKVQPLPLNNGVTVNGTNNGANNATNDSNKTPNNASKPVSRGTSTDEFLEATVDILTLIGQASDDWSQAADLGAEGNFDDSTAKLEDGLSAVEEAESILDDLDPGAETVALHDQLVDALAAARKAMEKGIEGNETDNIDAIDESGAAMEDLAVILEDVNAELEILTGETSPAV